MTDLVAWIASDELTGESEQSWQRIIDRAADFCRVVETHAPK